MEINPHIHTGMTVPPPFPGTGPGISAIPPLSEHSIDKFRESEVSEESSDDAEDLNLDDYEITRGEFFAHQREPSFIFNDCKVGVNTACVRKLEDVEYVQILINRAKKKLAVRACKEDDLYSLQWGNTKNGKRFPRQITGRIFFMKVCELMNWNPDFRYKILGKLVKANNERIFCLISPVMRHSPAPLMKQARKRAAENRYIRKNGSTSSAFPSPSIRKPCSLIFLKNTPYFLFPTGTKPAVKKRQIRYLRQNKQGVRRKWINSLILLSPCQST